MLIEHSPEVTKVLKSHQPELARAAAKGWGVYGKLIDRLLGPGNERSRVILKNAARLEQARKNGTLDQEQDLMFGQSGYGPELDGLRRSFSTVNPGNAEAPPSTSSPAESAGS